jgi:hypothetical protein
VFSPIAKWAQTDFIFKNMAKDKLTKEELAEIVYQTQSRHFDVDKFFKDINFPLLNKYLQDENETENDILKAYIFNLWIIVLSMQKIFPNDYKEVLNIFMNLWWNRGELKKTHKNIENLMLSINADFNKYENAIVNKNDPIFSLSKTFIDHIFKKEITDIRVIAHIGIYFDETLKAYEKIFSKIRLK